MPAKKLNGALPKPRPRRNAWDVAARQIVIRGNSIYPPAPLEPGVNFFVLMLEKLGATTTFSCEGHPRGFYVSFRADLALARAIADCGYLAVEVDRVGGFRLNLGTSEYTSDNYLPADRDAILRWAATAWVARFGACPVEAAPTAGSRKRGE